MSGLSSLDRLHALRGYKGSQAAEESSPQVASEPVQVTQKQLNRAEARKDPLASDVEAGLARGYDALHSVRAAAAGGPPKRSISSRPSVQSSIAGPRSEGSNSQSEDNSPRRSPSSPNPFSPGGVAAGNRPDLRVRSGGASASAGPQRPASVTAPSPGAMTEGTPKDSPHGQPTAPMPWPPAPTAFGRLALEEQELDGEMAYFSALEAWLEPPRGAPLHGKLTCTNYRIFFTPEGAQPPLRMRKSGVGRGRASGAETEAARAADAAEDDEAEAVPPSRVTGPVWHGLNSMAHLPRAYLAAPCTLLASAARRDQPRAFPSAWLELAFKDGRNWKVGFPQAMHRDSAAELLMRVAFPQPQAPVRKPPSRKGGGGADPREEAAAAAVAREIQAAFPKGQHVDQLPAFQVRDEELLGARGLLPEDIAAESSEYSSSLSSSSTPGVPDGARHRSGSLSMKSLAGGGSRKGDAGSHEHERPGWKLFDLVSDLRRVGARIEVPGEDMPSSDLTGAGGRPLWRVTTVNRSYGFSPTYPRVIVVPTGVTDHDLEAVRNYRSRGRIPCMVWRHPTNGCSLWRCAQPKAGMANRSCAEDERLFDLVRTSPARDVDVLQRIAAARAKAGEGAAAAAAASEAAQASGKLGPRGGQRHATAAQLGVTVKDVLIADCRPQTNALANKAGGWGYIVHPRTELQFLDIGNIHVMRSSLESLLSLLHASPRTDDNLGQPSREMYFGRAMEDTGWTMHGRMVMAGAWRVAHALHVQKRPVSVNCSDSWDRSSQIVALAELLLDPHYRTLKGFCQLIIKEWLSFGHQFHKRCAHGHTATQDYSPVFLQFIECVWNLLQQHPAAFEFNEHLLHFLAMHLHACRFGTFLCDNERQRDALQLSRRTDSAWAFVLHPHRRALFTNPLYAPPRKGTAGIVSSLLGSCAAATLRPVRPWLEYWSKFAPIPSVPPRSHAFGPLLLPRSRVAVQNTSRALATGAREAIEVAETCMGAVASSADHLQAATEAAARSVYFGSDSEASEVAATYDGYASGAGGPGGPGGAMAMQAVGVLLHAMAEGGLGAEGQGALRWAVAAVMEAGRREAGRASKNGYSSGGIGDKGGGVSVHELGEGGGGGGEREAAHAVGGRGDCDGSAERLQTDVDVGEEEGGDDAPLAAAPGKAEAGGLDE